MDKVIACFLNWNKGRELNWDEFERRVCNRFGDECLEDILEGFVKLRQENSVEEYHDEFEDIRIRLERLMLELGESYFLSGFIGGLKDEIRLMVKMMKPVSLSQPMDMAKLQEQLLDKSKLKGNLTSTFKTAISSNQPLNKNVEDQISSNYFFLSNKSITIHLRRYNLKVHR